MICWYILILLNVYRCKASERQTSPNRLTRAFPLLPQEKAYRIELGGGFLWNCRREWLWRGAVWQAKLLQITFHHIPPCPRHASA